MEKRLKKRTKESKQSDEKVIQARVSTLLIQVNEPIKV